MITLEQSSTGNLISPCNKCIFATWNHETDYHRTQVGCCFNRIKKFQDRGTTVEKITGDDEDYYRIHTFCNCIRDNEWAENQEKKDFNNLINKVKEDNKLKYSAIIIDEVADEHESIQKIKDSFTSFLQESVKPERVLIVVKNNFATVVTTIRSWNPEKIPVFFTRPLDDSTGWELINVTFGKVTGLYYIAVKSGFEIKGFTSKLDDSINDKCSLDMIIQSDNVMCCNSALHGSLGGHFEKSLEDRLRVVEKNADKYIKTYEEFNA